MSTSTAKKTKAPTAAAPAKRPPPETTAAPKKSLPAKGAKSVAAPTPKSAAGNTAANKSAAAPASVAGEKAAPATKKAAPGGTAASAPAVRKPPPSPTPTASESTKTPAKSAVAATLAKVAVPVPTLVPGAPLAVPSGVVPRKPGRGTPKYFVAPVQAPLPPPTSRFADRFAPPRPPTRQMNQQEDDTPRQAHKADPKLANAWKTKSGRELSEPEIMAMPDAEYMNEKQLEFFRLKLQQLKDDLLSNAGETTEHLREDTSIVPDPADRATIEEEHALELRTRDRERKLLKKISQSLGRIESGEYGFCDETGEPIGLGRLIARPTATLSLEAQQRRELKQKMFGD